MTDMDNVWVVDMTIVVPGDAAGQDVLGPLVPLEADQSCSSEVWFADCFERCRQRICYLPGRGRLGCLLPNALNSDPGVPCWQDCGVFALHDLPRPACDIEGIAGLSGAISFARTDL